MSADELTTYRRADLEREARAAVRNFKRTLPQAIRRTVEPDGWELVAHSGGTTLAAYFRDEYGRHRINVAL